MYTYGKHLFEAVFGRRRNA